MAEKHRAQARSRRRAKARRKKAVRRVLWRVALSFLTILVLLIAALLRAGYVGFKGPSQSMADLLTVTMQETSALKFVPRIYYSKAEMDEIMARNQVEDTEQETDTSLITIAAPTPAPTPIPTPVPPDWTPDDAAPEATQEPVDEGIEIYDVQGGTYKGFMMVVQDPSRVSVGVCANSFSSKPGLLLKDIAKRYDAVAAVNGGAFKDTGGTGNGGMPSGLVISQGKLLHGGDGRVVVGFTKENKLVAGKFSAADCEKYGVRDAVCFGPILVSNGKAATVKGASSGLNPRTAIGQRADGAVLLLVIDGRTAASLGATYADLISVMLEYGAVNAVNLDGGSSSMMYYKGEYLNDGVVLTGSRKMPTAFIVR